MRRRFIFRIFLGALFCICLGWWGQNFLVSTPSQTDTVSQNNSREELVQESSTPSPPSPSTTIIAGVDVGKIYNPPRGDVRLLVISDLNGIYGATDYDPEVDQGMELIPFWQPDMVICSGDMVAGQSPTLSPEKIRAMWASFDEHIAAPLRRAEIPYGFTIGNHDASSALGVKGNFLFQQERDLAAEYWHNSQHDPGIKFIDRYEFPFYYTFEH
jgi:hypothetical protein